MIRLIGYIGQDVPPTDIADRFYVALPLSTLKNSQYDTMEMHAHIDQFVGKVKNNFCV